MSHVNFLFLGLGNGAVFAALALALVITYRSSGVLNFATGAIAMFGAYTYAYLRKGMLLLIMPGLPRRYHFPGPVSFLPALLITIAMSALLGVIIYALVFRPLRAAVPVAKAVGSVGVMMLLTSLVAQAAGAEQVNVKPIFPQKAYEFGSVRIMGDRMWFAVTIVLIAALLAAFYRFTRFGLATRAASESEIGALVSGLKPERIALINWAISAALCGVAGLLIAPLTPLVPGTYTLFIVPALAAAVLGRFSALFPAVLGGIAIGMLQSEATFIHSTFDWTLSTGNSELVPLALVLVVLLVRGRPLPTRGTLLQRSLGKSPRPRHLFLPMVIFVPVGLAALIITDGSIRGAVIVSMIGGVLALSLVVVTGYAGQISLAQLTLAGVGGFLLSRFTNNMGVPFPVAPLLAALGAMVLGVIVGLPALRVRGLFLAVVTLTFAITVEAVWFRNADLNGGGSGGSVIKPARFLGIDLSVGTGLSYPRIQFGIMVLVMVTLVATGVSLLRRSRLGAAMLAVRANERSTAAAGISVVKVKMISFAIGAFIAGLGGALLAYHQGSITFQSFSALAGLSVLTTTYMAGITSVFGGLLAGLMMEGGVMFTAIDRNIEIGRWFGIVTSFGVIMTVLKNPEGIVGPAHAFFEHRRLAKLAEVDAASTDQTDRRRSDDIRVVPPPGDPLLVVRDLSVSYGGVVAVSDVDLTVREGQIVGLIGPNGAGKTTFMDAVSGFTASSGAVVLGGRELSGLPPHRRVAVGLGRTFQGIDLYEDLSVAENIAVGQQVSGERLAEAEASLHRIIELLDLSRVRERGVSEISQGERQLVSIARALAGRPRLLMLDEPAAGLDTNESLWLADRLHDIRSTGVTILLIDHDMSLVLSLCDEIHVLDFGSVIASGTPSEIRTNPLVTQAYLGTSQAEEVGS